MAARVMAVSAVGREVELLVEGGWHCWSWPQTAPLPQPGMWVRWPITDEKPVLLGGGAGWPDQAALYWHQPIPGGQEPRLQLLKKRHQIMRAVRGWLDHAGFLELESPLLVHGTTPDLALRSFAVEDRYLVTSTEYQIKRLIAGGAGQVYTLTKNFRDDPQSPVHNPEFTMLEWARVGVDLEQIEQDVEQFVLAANRALGQGDVVERDGRVIDLTPPWTRCSIQAAVAQHVGVDITGFDLEKLHDAAAAAGLVIRADHADDRIFVFTVLLDHIQQFMGWDKPVFLQDWPNFLTSSAAEKAGGLTERSELMIAGIEIADGFPSLTDAARQRMNFAREQAARMEQGLPVVALDDAYLAALESGLPQGAGMALGMDRLVMLLLNQPNIQAVMAFDWGRC